VKLRKITGVILLKSVHFYDRQKKAAKVQSYDVNELVEN
jgi:hypothetical protein